MNEILLERELTLGNSPAALAKLDGELGAATLSINFAALEVVDSSAVAVLLEWQRRAKAANCQLIWCNMPQNLLQLIAVYGLSEFFVTAS